MSKILGLDLGTNSIGWAIVDVDRVNNKEDFNLIDKGVLIYTEGVKKEKGNEISRAAERTALRSVRRLKFRRKLRKYETLLVLAKNEMCPLSVTEVIAWKKSNFKVFPNNEQFLHWLRTDDKVNKNPYYFRDKASKEKINELDLGRAFYHIAQRRGFLSNRLDQSDKGIIERYQPRLSEILETSTNLTELTIQLHDFFKELDILDKKSKDLNEGDKKLKTLYNIFSRILKNKDGFLEIKEKIKERLFKKENLGKVKQGIEDLDEKIKAGKFKTLGQYFYSIYGNTLERIRNNYTAREDHYLHEFEWICKKQNIGGIIETEKEFLKKYKGLTLELYKAIFFQRPLKSQKGLIGKCTLEPAKYRCPISRPEFEEFRMYQLLNTIKIKTPKDEKLRFLFSDEKEKIKGLFYRKSKPNFNFSEISSKLIPKHKTPIYYKSDEARDAEYIINYKRNTNVSGCPTIANFKNIFGDNWKELHYTYTTNVNGKEKNVQIDYTDIWHIWTTFTTKEKLAYFAKYKLKQDDAFMHKFKNVSLKKDYATLSLKAINNILPYLKDGLLYAHAVFMANMKHVVKTKNWNNKEDKSLIEKEIANIISTHQVKNKLFFVINGFIKKNFDNSYSKEADIIYRKELKAQFKKEFGKIKWETITNNELFETYYSIFVQKFKNKRFVQIKRIDEKIISFLKDHDLLKDKEKLYHPSDIEKFKLEKVVSENNVETIVLGSPLSNSIKNPMAMKALHKLRKLVNTLILEGKIDKRTKIHIELARELNDANKRKAIQKWQKEKEDIRKEYSKKIKEFKANYIPNETDILKYQLWEEQKHICLYTGNSINIEEFLGKNPKYDIEHTIPRSVSIDDSQQNKTLCESRFNREVKKNQIPYQLKSYTEVLKRIQHWKTKCLKLEDEIAGLVRASKTASDKEKKDRIIQKRHYLKMKYRYWKEKYKRFELKEIKSGFKNSQISDIGIITKYAQQYLRSYFDKVYSVNGTMVDQFKKIWGIKKVITDANGIEKKDRTNHIHHCEDAITIACMTKNKYDILAHAWRLEENEILGNRTLVNVRKMLQNSKPWKTFTEDVRNIYKEVLIVHTSKNKVPIQSKKILRKRGKRQYNKRGNLIYLQGDTVRGSLHQDTFYGAIKKKDIDTVYYVVRKPLDGIKKTDVDKIVDEVVKGIIKKAIEDNVLIARGDSYKLEKDKKIWMHKDKKIPINKVRIYMPSVKNPIQDFKKHAKPFLSKKEYKQAYHVQNDENYCMAIYEGKDKKGNVKRTYELVNMLDAGSYYKLSNMKDCKEHGIVPIQDIKTGYPLKNILTKNTQVLFYRDYPDEIWELDTKEIKKRLYKIIGFEADGRIQFRFHQTAMQQSSANKNEMTIVKYMKENNLKNSEIDFENPVPWLRLSRTKFDFIVNKKDFEISEIGIIKKYKSN